MANQEKKPKPNTNNLYIIITIVIAVVLIGAVLYWQNNNDTPQNSNILANNTSNTSVEDEMPKVCNESYCLQYDYGTCPSVCSKRCVPSKCQEDDNGIIVCTEDCSGKSSCYCEEDGENVEVEDPQYHLINFEPTGTVSKDDEGYLEMKYNRPNGQEATVKLLFDHQDVKSNCTIGGDDILCQEVVDNNLITPDSIVTVQGNKISATEVLVIYLLN